MYSNVPLGFSRFSRTLAAVAAIGLLIAATRLAGQNPQTSLTILSREGRRTIPISTVNGQERVALDDLATAFQLTVREEAGALTVSYRGRVIVLTADQTIASVAGRLVSLSAPPIRSAGRWLVPLDFINRSLALLYDARLDLRRTAHLLVVGDLRVPRVVVRQEAVGATGGRITIEATPRATITPSPEGGQRILVKVDADAVDPLFPPIQPQGIIAGIRLVDTATLSIDLTPRFGAYRPQIQVQDSGSRVILELGPAQQADSAAAPPPLPPRPDEKPAVLPTLETGGLRTVAIDAGHGGTDVGVRGGRGTLEKDVTLAVARRLKAAIEGRLGLRVILTRDEDRLVPLDDRAATANHNKAELFISLHAGAAFRNTVSGAGVYLAAFNESSSSAPVLVPERVPTFGGGLRDIELVPWGLAQIRYTESSERMAALLAEQFMGHIPLAPDPVQRTPLRVLKSANMPAVLVEMGYLTSPEQERQLAAPDFQNTIVQAMLDAISRFREWPVASEGGPR